MVVSHIVVPMRVSMFPSTATRPPSVHLGPMGPMWSPRVLGALGAPWGLVGAMAPFHGVPWNKYMHQGAREHVYGAPAHPASWKNNTVRNYYVGPPVILLGLLEALGFPNGLAQAILQCRAWARSAIVRRTSLPLSGLPTIWVVSCMCLILYGGFRAYRAH